MAFSYQGNPPLPPSTLNPPPPPPSMNPMQLGMMASQQGIGMTAPMMTPQGFMQPAPPGTQQQQQQQQQQQLQLQQMQQMQQLQQMQQMQQSMMNPAMNDAPLEFNVNKNKPPMPLPVDERSQNRNLDDSMEDTRRERDRRGSRGDRRDRERERDRDRDRMRDRERNREDRDSRQREDKPAASGGSTVGMVTDRGIGSNGNVGVVGQDSTPQEVSPTTTLGPSPGQPQPQPQPQPAMGPAANNMWGGMMGPMGYPMMGMNPMMGGMMGDPNMMPTMGQYGMMGSMMPDGTMLGPDGGMMPMEPTMMGPMVKEIIHCKSCTLFPPNPNAPPPTTRERPPGCRTIFVGGLPENITEEIIREIFERCGEMQTIRLSKKNFCHIRFVFEASVDAAIYLSGYRIRLGSNTDAPNTGRLHVDYAQARDDLYEWECRQRALQREQRHRERMEQERMRPPSPPPVVHYTDHEALAISEKIKAVDDSFTLAVQVVITWLERGDCNKRNANTFYTMIQSTNSHVRRLLSEKTQYEEELQRARELMKGRMQGLLIQFGQIERVFAAASHKKVWDHFTKAQRKNIEMWKKQTMEIKSVQLEEVLNERADEEMEVSDEEDYLGNKKRARYDNAEDRANLACIKEENDSLRCQLEAYKNEVDLVRSDMKAEVDQKDKQLKMLQQTLQGMQQQLMDTKRRQAEDDMKLRDLQARLRAATEAQVKKAAVSEVQVKDREGDEAGSGGGGDGPETEEEKLDQPKPPTPAAAPPAAPQVTDREAKLIGLISTFLHVHPFGAGVDYVWSYLQKLDPTIRPTEVELLMSRFPTVFRQELSGIGANMERRWQFVGFELEPSLSSLGLSGLHSSV